MLALLVTALASLSAAALASPTYANTTSLADLALQKVLQDAAPMFGSYAASSAKTASWMASIPDSTKIVHMNIPGVHDSATWNYSVATQTSLDHVTALDGTTPAPPEYYRCQEKSMIDMLNAGIRVFDLRYAFDTTNSTLVFWHSEALLSETATVDDVMFGFYHWLDDHPTEALFLSFQYESSTTLYGSNDAAVQLELFATLTSPAAQKYILQTKDQFGTLGEARGHITLLRRFDFDQLPAEYEAAIPGVHFSPTLWTDNSPDITLVYNAAQNLTAYVEDFYGIDAPIGTNASLNIQWKYNATTAHIQKATTMYPDSLFWTWASSEYTSNIPPETPKIMALGNGTAYTPLGGVNQRLIPFLQQQKGKRVGMVMFDFYDMPSNLVETLLDI
ncbi:hypothetical protein BP5796_11554 [Coleophoma crateriformis]|uniref:Phosphatidylinositol-specific phospholipase C X domain-containing protein n=1 Tax=Coleophoma crateriformis TaxID=565419 RepID=A0A3D8QIK3_9HELO|nr:hypothetical protein BP5796_11554 [Coleophoma crateriformis]